MNQPTLMINRKVKQRLPLVIDADWPMSLGYPLYLVSRHPLTLAESRATKQDFEFIRNGMSGDAMHATWDGTYRCQVIMINVSCPKVRLIELVTHECSHWVDEVLARCQVRKTDTEVRAYLLGWVVGKVLKHFKL